MTQIETPEQIRQRRDATRKILTCSSALVVGSALALSVVRPGGPPHAGVPWWALAFGFAAAEALTFELEIGRENQQYTFSEAPLVFGLLLASPWALIVGRLVGEALYLIVFDRKWWDRVAFNVAIFGAECATAISVLALLRANFDTASWTTWLAVLAAVAAADFVSAGALVAAIRWLGGDPQPAATFLACGFSALNNTALGLLVTVAAAHSPGAYILFAVVALNLTLAIRRVGELHRRYERLQLFHDFTRAVAQDDRAEHMVAIVLRQARDLLRAEYARIVLHPASPDDGDIVVCELRDDDIVQLSTATAPALARIDGDVHTIMRGTTNAPDRALLAELHVRDCIVATITRGTELAGTLVVGDRVGNTGTFDDHDARLLETVANHASVVLENSRLIDRLTAEIRSREHQALHDSLTGLANRAKFAHHLEHELAARADGEHVAVFLMDLDRFKDVNDTLGHYAGDLLLQHVARILRAALPEGALAARFGGDEFALCIRTRDPQTARAVAVSIQESLLRPVTLESVVIDSGGSIGMAIAPDQGDDPTTLLQRADVAMYRAKRGGTVIEQYDGRDDVHSVERLAMAAALRNAVTQQELVVYYQPKARLADGTIVGAEALVRWNHPELGLVYPDEFITLAEQIGLIAPLTDYVLTRALQQLRRWHLRGHDLDVAVNVAASTLLDRTFPIRLESILLQHLVPPDRLTLEITESRGLELSAAHRALGHLRDIGVRVSVDDFGTGYSSLSYLHALPVQEVKIDRSFVQTLANDRQESDVVRAIVELGHNLGLTVVAEGVEEQRTWDLLANLGCDLAQGYLLSRPIPGDELTAWLDLRPRPASTVRDRCASQNSSPSKAKSPSSPVDPAVSVR